MRVFAPLGFDHSVSGIARDDTIDPVLFDLGLCPGLVVAGTH